MKTIVSVIPVEDEDKRLLEQAAPGYRLLFAQPREIPADGSSTARGRISICSPACCRRACS